MSSPQPREKKKLLIKLAAALVCLLVAGVLVIQGVDLKAWGEKGLDLLRGAGPVAFFTAMALLPAAGLPMMTFSLTAGSAFADQMGMGTVIVCGLAAVTVNVAVTYWLATKALRPLLSNLLQRLGYKIPEVPEADMTDMIVIVRVTPGPPFFTQNYLLGLARAPFGKYMLISCGIAWSYNAAFIVFGDALLHGKGKAMLMGVLLLVALVAVTHLLRRHYGRKQSKA